MAKKKTALAAAPAPIPKKIRMLKELGTPRRAFFVGATAIVGVDVSEETAAAWVAQGAAKEERGQ